MVENGRNLRKGPHYFESGFKTELIRQETIKEIALESLGASNNVDPSKVSKVGSMFMTPELMLKLRVPYAVEVLGMPRAGKTTLINRYLTELWDEKRRHEVGFIDEGARKIKDEYGDLRYTDPFTYSMLGGDVNFMAYTEIYKQFNHGAKMIISDRGQVDRRAFRRALFEDGHVSPKLMKNEEQFIFDLENTPVQMGALILLMVRPEVSIKRSQKEGPIANMDFLPKLYEQYWRLHWEVLQRDVPFRIYTCINGENDMNTVYESFKTAMDNALNMHAITHYAFAKAYPEVFEEVKREFDKNGPPKSLAKRILEKRLGKKVFIVGGDEMESENEVLQKRVITGIKIR